MKRSALAATLAFGAALLGCQARNTAPAAPTRPQTSAQAAPAAAPVDVEKLLEPPPPGITADAPFPPVVERELPNGLALRIVERHVHPLVELRLVVRSGMATDGEKPGLSAVAGELLKAGGAGPYSPQKLVERAESLGTSLDIATDRESTRISLSVTSGELDAAFEILSVVALRPTFVPVEFDKLRTREVERVKSSARGSASWAASMMLYRELFELPTSVHPYSRYDATPDDLAKLTLGDCRGWHKTHFVPANAAVVVAGDVTPEAAERAATKWFSAWKGEAPPRPSFSQPFPKKERQVILVDRPGSAQSQVFVGLLGAERASPDWPALAAANHILGGGVSSRLFLDVREKRSLAYNTGSSLGETRVGPVPMVLSAGTQTAKTPDTVAALLENLDAIASHAPKQHEVDASRRFLSDSFVFRLESAGSVADLTAHLYVLGLPNDYYDEYRKAVRALEVPKVSAVGGRYYRGTPIIVVAGDAATLGAQLAAFGPVSVVDPENAFSLKRSFPKKP